MLRSPGVAATALVLFGLAASPATAATIPVTTTGDEYGSGTGCSLREAVESANGDADFDNCTGEGAYGSDVVEMPAGPFTLSLGSPGENANLGGDIDITGSLILAGDGNGSECLAASTTCIDANDLDRALDLREGLDPVAVTLRDLTIADGDAGASDGGAISSLESDATLALERATVVSSEAADGGAIRSDGVLSLSETLLSDNSASGSGGAVEQAGSSLTVASSRLAANEAVVDGGGVRVESGASAAFSASEISANEVTAGDGGGISNAGGLSLEKSTLDSNEALSGGGIQSSSGGVIVASTLSANRAGGTCGGGAGDGGAIEQSAPGGGGLALVNSTISGNSAGCRGGGIRVFDSAASTDLTAVTVSENSALSGGGGVDNEADVNGSSTLVLRGTILSGNPPVGCGGDGPRLSGGGNLDSGTSCGSGSSDLLGTEPVLGPLRFTGGPTRTRLPVTFSPAVNALAGCIVSTDQRGVARPVGGRCDIGAVEASPAPLCRAVGASIVGTPGNDVLRGTPAADVIAGLGGNDVIAGLGGNDLVCAGAGNDTVAGGRGNDKLRGEEGKDKLSGGPGRDLLVGGKGKDKLKGGKGKDKLKQQ